MSSLDSDLIQITWNIFSRGIWSPVNNQWEIFFSTRAFGHQSTINESSVFWTSYWLVLALDSGGTATPGWKDLGWKYQCLWLWFQEISKLTISTNVVPLDVIEGHINIPLLQFRVVLEVLEDFGHNVVAEVGVAEHFKSRNVGPKEVAISVVHIMRPLKICKCPLINDELMTPTMVMSLLVSNTYFITFLSFPKSSATATMNMGMKPSGKNSGARFVSTLTVGILEL